MGKREFTTEELTSRWEDLKTIENMMGKRTFLGILKGSKTVWADMWCKKAPDPSLGFNGGYYKGYEAVEGYYNAIHDLTVLRTELVQKAHPEKLAEKSIDEIYGVGSFVANNISTPIIEVAADGKTAKGMWYVMGCDIDLQPSGPESYWSWGRIGADFVKEDGAWKIWHMVFAEDIYTPVGTSWKDEIPAKPVKPEFAAVADFKMPEPNVPCTVHERWHKRRQLKPFPAMPFPYETFSDTFSYGV